MMVMRGCVISIHSVGPLESSQQAVYFIVFCRRARCQMFLVSPDEGDGDRCTAGLGRPVRAEFCVQPVDDKTLAPARCLVGANTPRQPEQQTRRPAPQQHDQSALPQPDAPGSFAYVVQERSRQQGWIVVTGLLQSGAHVQAVLLVVKGHTSKKILLGRRQQAGKRLLVNLVYPGRERAKKLPYSIHR